MKQGKYVMPLLMADPKHSAASILRPSDKEIVIMMMPERYPINTKMKVG